MAAGGPDPAPDLDLSRSSLTTPRAAAVAGILFSLLLMTSLVMLLANLGRSRTEY